MRWSAIPLIALLSSRGGGGGGGSSTSPPPVNPPAVVNASLGGVYSGTIFSNGLQRPDPVAGVVTESGEGPFLNTRNGAAYTIQFTVNGNFAAGTFMANTVSGLFPGAQSYGNGTQQSTIGAGTSITGTYTTPFDTGNFSLNNQYALYGAGSSLTTITGTYPSGTLNLGLLPWAQRALPITTTIQSDGTFSIRDSLLCLSRTIARCVLLIDRIAALAQDPARSVRGFARIGQRSFGRGCAGAISRTETEFAPASGLCRESKNPRCAARCDAKNQSLAVVMLAVTGAFNLPSS